MDENKEGTTEGSAEKFFKELGKKLDQFTVELKDAGTRAEVDMKQKLEEIKASAERIKREAQDKERWKEVEASLKRAGQELESAFKSAFKKKEQP